MELKMPGLEIGSNVNGINLGEERFHPFFKRAEELGCALFVHPWEMMGEQQMQKYWLPWLVGMPAETSRAICSLIFSGVMAKFPKFTRKRATVSLLTRSFSNFLDRRISREVNIKMFGWKAGAVA